MNNSMTEAMAGNTSPSKLAPETIKIRNALIEKYADLPIEELNNFLQRALEVEKDELKRLGLLAARVYILRQKVISLKAFIRDERMDSLPTANLALTEQILLDETANSDIDINNQNITAGEWHSLQMIEPGEVNGVRFFQGTVINAKAEDAEKLISSGKAVIIDNEGNRAENNTTDKVTAAEAADEVTAAEATDEVTAAEATDEVTAAEATDEVTAAEATDEVTAADENTGAANFEGATEETVEGGAKNNEAGGREGIKA